MDFPDDSSRDAADILAARVHGHRLKQFWSLFEPSAVISLVVEAGGRIVRYNDAVTHLLDRYCDDMSTLDELIRQCCPDDEQRQAFLSLFGDEDCAGGIEVFIVRPNGEQRLVRFSACMLGSVVADDLFLVQGVDLTDRLRCSDVLRKAQNMIRRVFTYTCCPMLFLDTGSAIVEVNHAFASIQGYPPDFYRGKPYFSLFPDPGREEVFRRVLETSVPHVACRPDGWDARDGGSCAEWTLHPIHDDNGQVDGLMLTFLPNDGTSPEPVREAVLRPPQHEFNAEIQEAYFIRDFREKRIVYVSPSFEAIWGKSPESIYADERIVLEMVHPDDRARAKEMFNMKPPFHTATDVLRIVPQKGEIRWMRVRGFPIPESDGSMMRYGVIIEDVTELTHTRVRLTSTENELRRKARNLEEANTALRILLEHLDDEKRKMEDHFADSLKTLVVPYIEKLRLEGMSEEQQVLMGILQKNIDKILKPGTDVRYAFDNLTPTERQIAELIRDGKSTKDIATILTMSENAVYFHRKNLRIKLGLHSNKKNLHSYLTSLRGV